MFACAVLQFSIFSCADSWIDELPEPVKTHVITDPDASRFSGSFGANWRQVLTRLGISDTKIDIERQNDPFSGVVNITTTLLIKWRQQVYKKATVEALLSVLREVDEEGVCSIDWGIVKRTLSKINP